MRQTAENLHLGTTMVYSQTQREGCWRVLFLSARRTMIRQPNRDPSIQINIERDME